MYVYVWYISLDGAATSSFRSNKSFCRDKTSPLSHRKSVFVVTNVLPRKGHVCGDKIFLLRQNICHASIRFGTQRFCRDKHTCLSRQNVCGDKKWYLRQLPPMVGIDVHVRLLKTENKFCLRRLLLHACRMWGCIICVWVYLHIIHEYNCILDRVYIRGFALYFFCHLAHTWMRMVRLFFAVVMYWTVIWELFCRKVGLLSLKKANWKIGYPNTKRFKRMLIYYDIQLPKSCTAQLLLGSQLLLDGS